jgi:hypothetical protein
MFELDLKKTKKYFKVFKKSFLESFIADDNTIRSNSMYHLEIIEKYVKKVQLLNLQSY